MPSGAYLSGQKAPSHPVTTVLLIVSAIALIISISLQAQELGRYRNETTKGQLENYTIKPVAYYESQSIDPTVPAGQ